MYVFIITQSGERTAAKVTEVIAYDVNGLVNKAELGNSKWRWDRKQPILRIAKLNDESFGMKKSNELTLKEFEDIFSGELSVYRKCRLHRFLVYYPKETSKLKYPFFRKEVYLKYGIESE